MTHYKLLINVVYNDEDYYVRKRKISCAAETLQGKHRYKKKKKFIIHSGKYKLLGWQELEEQ